MVAARDTPARMPPMLVIPGPGPWTGDDIDEETTRLFRIEVVDGGLVVNAQARHDHQYVADSVCMLLRSAVPAGLVAMREIAVGRLGDHRVPDVCTVPRDTPGDTEYHAPDVVDLAVEVVSPTTRRTDRITKPAQYAEWGIPWFWRVELDPEPVAHLHELRGGAYVENAVVRAGESLAIERPYALVVAPQEWLA